ncbi:MAG: endonuclease/exonuclease/phosphatase family protein [Flavobacteriaceae bacterium]|nr:endonuclease/exonuclease/phosphatase family protein [Flavobacteriaceae bacterium]
MTINKPIAFIFMCFWMVVTIHAQKQFKAHTIAFYNVENLFDTINDPFTFDDDRTPDGRDKWTYKIYRDKLAKTAKVIADIGSDFTKNAPVVIGLSEIENRFVLEDLVKEPQLLPYNYGIIHFDSPDERGIDVALLYQRHVFAPENFSKHFLELYDNDDPTDRDYTRDQLLVSGKLEGETFHFIVNHWPSRSGGEQRSRSKRLAAASLNKKIIDSLFKIDSQAKIMTMGDFNDDPTNESIRKVLNAKSEQEGLDSTDLYNPMANMLKKGMGTLGYRDSWNIFDQIILSGSLLGKDFSSYRYYKAGIFNASYLIAKTGRYKGYPFRSYADGGYTGGYSDHFPVYVHIIKEVH